MEKRRNSTYFQYIFQYISSLRSQIIICEMWLFDLFFPQFFKSGISRYVYLEVFQSLGFRDNESRLYNNGELGSWHCFATQIIWIILFGILSKTSQRARDVYTMSPQRLCNFMTSIQRRCNVMTFVKRRLNVDVTTWSVLRRRPFYMGDDFYDYVPAFWTPRNFWKGLL